MLEKVEFIFPKNDENIELFDLISNLLKGITYVKNLEGKEILMQSLNLKPAIVFKLGNVNEMRWHIGNKKYLNFLNRKANHIRIQSEIKKLSLQEVLLKLSRNITRIDHIGINLPTNLVDQKEWEDLIKDIASISNLYNYPTGEPWPFLLPATKEENKKEITNFEMIREPRLELVYDKYTDVITIHFDLETDLSKDEVENLFPKDKGVYFENLENVYKAIYLKYSQDIDIRLDVRYKCIHNRFESGEWFVSRGKRITIK